jgi:CheY-like chemotaxis protein
MKVLLVDDTPGMRSFFKEQIIALGHEVVEAVDGLDAVEKLFGDSDRADETIGAVITDLSMPNMNGEQLIEYLESHGSHMPCLLHSAAVIDKPPPYSFVRHGSKDDYDHVENFLKAVA